MLRAFFTKRNPWISVVLCLLLVFLFTFPVFSVSYTPDVDIQAKAVYLYNLDTESLIFEKNAEEPMYPASLTKIMTCILALEQTNDLDAQECTYPNYVQDYLYSYGMQHGAISLGGLKAGEVLSMRQLLYACMLPSANEAAMIVADHIGGSQEEFCQMMNKRAKELGANNTNFVNANGLHDENHVTTAADMAKIALHAMELPGFMEIVSATFYDSGPTNMRENVTWNTTIKMQIPKNPSYFAGLRGIKTGSVPEAGDCFISTCTRDGFTYLLVIMGSNYLDAEGNALPQRGAFVDTEAIYTDVFENLRRKTLIDKGTRVHEIKLNLSLEQDHIKLMTGERFTDLVKKTTEVSDVTRIPEIPESWDAPVKKGDHIGELRLILAGEEVGSVPLLAAESVDASAILVIWSKIRGVMSSFWFKFLLILVLLLVVLYVILMILRNRNRRRKNYRPRRRI